MKTKKKIPLKDKVAKVPVILQLEALECGAASLTMILAYYDKWVPLEQVRVDCGVSRDGSNAKNILLAARGYGLSAKGYRYEPDALKEKGTFPCMIHWNFNHFIVLNGFKKNKAIINDPAKGMVEISMEEFDQSFTGICLQFAPTDAFVPDGKQKSMGKFIAKRLQGAGVAMAFTMVISLITTFIGMIYPVFSKIFMDRLLTGHNSTWIVPFFFFMLVFSVIQIVISAMQAVYSLKIDRPCQGAP